MSNPHPLIFRQQGAHAGRHVVRIARMAVRFIFLMLVVSMVSFLLVGLSPVDPVANSAGQAVYAHMDAATRAQLATWWGSDQPIPSRYLTWAFSAVHGDLGTSLRFNRPVVEVVIQRASASWALMLVSWLMSGLFGIVLGVVAGMRPHSALDRAISGFCVLLSSIPVFWIGILALMVFSVGLGWFPLGFAAPVGRAASAVTVSARPYHLLLPALVLSVTGVASVALHTREKMVDVMGSEYVHFARMRGQSETYIVLMHGMRNLVLPALAIQFAQIGEVFGGSILVEQVFSYPGLGQAAITAGVGGDAPLLVGIALASAALVFIGNAVSDVFAHLLDPRLSDTGGVHE